MINNPPIIILVSPQLGENIGSVCRIMENFSFPELRLVTPKPNWLNSKTEAMAVGGKKILDNIKVFDDLADAVEGVANIYALSARSRKMYKPHKTIKEHIEYLKEESQELGEKTAILFGSERCGLLNDEIAYAKSIISIPANQNYSSLNLSHAVGVICYEYYMLLNEVNVAPKKQDIDIAKVKLLFEDLKAKLECTDFVTDKERAVSTYRNIFNIFTRNNLNIQEVNTLFGVFHELFNYNPRKTIDNSYKKQ